MDHIFNESEKRFEPLEKICQFCLYEKALDMEKNYFRPVFKVVNRSNLIVYSSVKYNEVSVGISRCLSCYEIHKHSKRNSFILSISLALIFIYLGFKIYGIYGIFAIILSPIIIFLIPSLLIPYLISKSGIRTTDECVKSDPFIRDLILNGWSLSGPNP